MVAILAPIIQLPFKENNNHNQYFNNQQYIPAIITGGCSSCLPLDCYRTARWFQRRRREAKAAAFWQPHLFSKPTSIEMEPIDSMEKFDEVLRESHEQSQPILVDWMAAWCRKCIYLKPKLEKLAAEFHPRIKFYVVDVNNVPQALVKRGNISKMPTIQLWKDGEWKDEVIGGHKAWLVMDEVREMIRKHI